MYEEYYGTEDERIMVPNRYAALSREYDEAGNAIVLKFYDLENKPVIINAGYYELRRQFDDKKRVIREEFFGLNGEPVNNKDGFSLRLTEYGSDGKATKTMYNLDGDKVETE